MIRPDKPESCSRGVAVEITIPRGPSRRHSDQESVVSNPRSTCWQPEQIGHTLSKRDDWRMAYVAVIAIPELMNVSVMMSVCSRAFELTEWHSSSPVGSAAH